MKIILILSSLLLISPAFSATEESPFDRAHQQLGWWTNEGTTPEGKKCLIWPTYTPGEPTVTPEYGTVYYLFGMHVEIKTEDGKSFNYVANHRVSGGRGDCPRVKIDTPTEFKIRNNPKLCVAPRGREGAVGMKIIKDSGKNKKLYSIWGKDDNLLIECLTE